MVLIVFSRAVENTKRSSLMPMNFFSASRRRSIKVLLPLESSSGTRPMEALNNRIFPLHRMRSMGCASRLSASSMASSTALGRSSDLIRVFCDSRGTRPTLNSYCMASDRIDLMLSSEPATTMCLTFSSRACGSCNRLSTLIGEISVLYALFCSCSTRCRLSSV